MRTTIEGTLREIVATKEGKNGTSIVNFVIQQSGTVPQNFYITAFCNKAEEMYEIENYVGEPVKAECYLNGKQFSNGEKKFYNELKLITFK